MAHIPLPPVDAEQVAAFWARAIAAGVAPPGSPVPPAEPFGDHVDLADELIELVLAGTKRATAGSYDEYLQEGGELPHVGWLTIAADGAGRGRAVLRTTDVRIGPLASVDDQFAWDEGEGDRTRDWWLDAHTTYFSRWLPQVGLAYSPDMPTVFERFEVLYSES